MRKLLPDPADDFDLWDAYFVEPDSRFVRVNMISSLDGAVTVDGRAGGLGNDTDRTLLSMLRAQADVILVGAETVRVEGYGPVVMRDEFARRRSETGRKDPPPIAVVTRTAALDWSSSLFTDERANTIVLTGASAVITARVSAGGGAQIVEAGEDDVDMRRAVDALVDRGYRHILCEGGPTLNGSLIDHELVDELCLTIAPVVEQGNGPRVAAGPAREVPLGFELTHLIEDDSYLFLRLHR